MSHLCTLKLHKIVNLPGDIFGRSFFPSQTLSENGRNGLLKLFVTWEIKNLVVCITDSIYSTYYEMGWFINQYSTYMNFWGKFSKMPRLHFSIEVLKC